MASPACVAHIQFDVCYNCRFSQNDPACQLTQTITTSKQTVKTDRHE
jgi:hypothetical protein